MQGPVSRRALTDSLRRATVMANLKLENERERRRTKAKSEAQFEEWWPTPAEQWVLFVPCRGPSPVYVNYNAWIPTPGQKRPGFSLPCRCDNERKNTPCVLHWMRKVDMEQRRRDPSKRGSKSPYWPKENYAVTTILWGYYHLRPVASQIDDETGRVFMRWVPCNDDAEVVDPNTTKCNVCKEAHRVLSEIKNLPDTSLNEEQAAWKRLHKRTFGVRKYFNMGAAYFNAFTSINRRLSRFCRCGGQITTVRYVCPDCFDRGETTVIMDPRSTTLSREDQATFWKRSIRCPKCSYEGAPFEIVRCSDCDDPRPRSIFDQPICVVREGEKPNVVMSMVDFDRQPMDFDALPDDIKALLEPHDFEAIFAVSTKEQADMLGIEDPFDDTSGGQTPRAASVESVDYSK